MIYAGRNTPTTTRRLACQEHDLLNLVNGGLSIVDTLGKRVYHQQLDTTLRGAEA